MKAIKRRRGQDAKEYLAQTGVTVVPGKGVFTVKPPSKPGKKFRRKSRIVSCGNFQPKDNAELNYSGGNQVGPQTTRSTTPCRTS